MSTPTRTDAAALIGASAGPTLAAAVAELHDGAAGIADAPDLSDFAVDRLYLLRGGQPVLVTSCQGRSFYTYDGEHESGRTVTQQAAWSPSDNPTQAALDAADSDLQLRAPGGDAWADGDVLRDLLAEMFHHVWGDVEMRRQVFVAAVEGAYRDHGPHRCHDCGVRWRDLRAQYTLADGSIARLCGPCWDASAAYVCDLCDLLTEEYTLDADSAVRCPNCPEDATT